jgi:hypothetical protein
VNFSYFKVILLAVHFSDVRILNHFEHRFEARSGYSVVLNKRNFFNCQQVDTFAFPPGVPAQPQEKDCPVLLRRQGSVEQGDRHCRRGPEEMGPHPYSRTSENMGEGRLPHGQRIQTDAERRHHARPSQNGDPSRDRLGRRTHRLLQASPEPRSRCSHVVTVVL